MIFLQAHIAEMKAVKEGDSEQNIEGLYMHEFSKRGARYSAYNPIVAGGENVVFCIVLKTTKCSMIQIYFR